MVERRKPLILSSTKNLIDSVLKSSNQENWNQLSDTHKSTSLRFPAGILRFSEDQVPFLNSDKGCFDDSTLVGVSASILKRLAITSGSLILVKNAETNVQRIGRVVVLDPPDTEIQECPSEIKVPISDLPRAMVVFPSYTLPKNDNALFDCGTAYLSPFLAFNLDLHLSCLKTLVQKGKDSLTSLFEVKDHNQTSGKGIEVSEVNVELVPWDYLPGYASHLRASFVKIPECGILESLKGNSSIETEARQEMIDLALHSYFKVDRYLARGDVFCIYIDWNCKSEICISCSQRDRKNMRDGPIYFKVIGIEPSGESVFRVNCNQTALVLGGSIPSAVPPDSLVCSPKQFVCLQGNAVKNLALILTPSLCPSALSSKFRVAVLLYGLAGCGKRTVVRYVARCLGLHVVEFSCHDLMSSSERKVSVALVQAFNTAQRYSPTILLLRHFDVFRNLASQEGSPSDQVGIISEIASVIREFTDPISSCGDFCSEENANPVRVKI